jgi:hypothetical protein
VRREARRGEEEKKSRCQSFSPPSSFPFTTFGRKKNNEELKEKNIRNSPLSFISLRDAFFNAPGDGGSISALLSKGLRGDRSFFEPGRRRRPRFEVAAAGLFLVS